MINSILPELVTTGRVLRPELGWQLVDTDQGPMVFRLRPGGPAEEAGIRPIERQIEGVFARGYRRDIDGADLIVKVNGQRVASRDEVEDAVRETRQGASVTLTVRTGSIQGRERKVTVKPEMR